MLDFLKQIFIPDKAEPKLLPWDPNHFTSIKPFLKCEVCGNGFTAVKEKHYVAMNDFDDSKKLELYDAFDCPICESQVITQSRKRSIIKRESNQRILYLCDGKACEICHLECKHTTDISHAVSFKKGLKGLKGTYIEVESGNMNEIYKKDRDS